MPEAPRNGWTKFLVKTLWALVVLIVTGMFSLSFWGYCDLSSKVETVKEERVKIIDDTKEDIDEKIGEIKIDVKEIKVDIKEINKNQAESEKVQIKIVTILEQIEKKVNQNQ